MIRICTSTLALALTIGFSSFVAAQEKTDTTPPSKTEPAPETKPAPDNTKTNKRDRKESEPTADQQKNNKTDLQVTAEIRRAVIADKSLSTYAHNVKIIAQDGKVTLKGPVHSEAEKTTIEQKAVAVVGQANVTNHIDIEK